MAEILFYKNLVPLNKEQHRGHSFKRFESLDFATRTQSVLLTGSEYGEACKEYPIVFVKAPDNSVMSIALLGFREKENLFVDANGKWDAHYIPGYVRRYPFIFSEANPEQLVLCVDEGCANLNTTGEGEALFDDKGEASGFVSNIVKFMQDYQVDFLRTRAFLEHLQQLDLLKESSAQITLQNNQEFVVNGIWMVDEAKLMALGDDKLLQLAKSGELSRIYAHLISLSNLGNFALMDAKRASAATS
jgi:hypothetical protein